MIEQHEKMAWVFESISSAINLAHARVWKIGEA
jgi:hypothetical protein